MEQALPGQRGRSAPPELAPLGAALLAGLDPLTDRLVDAIVAEDPSYTALGTPTRADLRQSCRDNLLRILQALSGTQEVGAGDPYDAPHVTGRLRAEQGVPLESVLHAYRLGQRTIWEQLVIEARRSADGSVDLLVDAASEVWELVNSFSAEVARAYRETELQIARHDDRRRDALIDALLEGRGRERALAVDAANALDLPEHGQLCVVVVTGTEHARHAAAALAAAGMRSAWRTRADREVGLVSIGRAGPSAVGPALQSVGIDRAGMSPVVDGLAQVDVAHRLATTALRTQTRPGGVVELDDALPAALLVTAPDLATRLLHRVLGGVLALTTDEREVLLATLTGWLECGGSASQTAARLYCHRNTVLNRLKRIEVLTGRSVDRVDDVLELRLAVLARALLDDAQVR